MTPEITAWLQWASISIALWGALSRHGKDDCDVIECNEYVLDALADADTCRTVECVTDHDLRSQVTVEDAQRLYDEAEATKRRGRWN